MTRFSPFLIEKSIVEEMKEIWGGNLPSWEDFKKASKNGTVRTNKTVAAMATQMKGYPQTYFILYSIITLWLGYLLFPATLVAWLFMSISAWWIPISLVVAWFLIKVSRTGHCEGMLLGAENNEGFYVMLVNRGAFFFLPDQ